MAAIVDKESVAQHLRAGIRAIADQEKRKVGATEEEIAERLSISVFGLRSWTNPSSIPNSIDSDQLLGLAWLVLTRGDKGLDWLRGLLRGTEMVVEPLSRDLIRAYLQRARLSGKVFADAEVEQLVERLFRDSQVQAIAEPDSPDLGSKIGEETASAAQESYSISTAHQTKKRRNIAYRAAMIALPTIIVLSAFLLFLVFREETPVCLGPIAFADPIFLPDQGFSLYQTTSDPSKSSILSNSVRSVGINAKGLWVGYIPGADGIDGINYFDRINKQWIHCPGLKLVAGQVANDFAFRGDSVYIGTDGNGVAELQQTGWQIYTNEHGLPSNSVYSLSIDEDGELWATTNEGVAQLVGKRWEAVYQANIGELAGNHVHHFVDDEQGNRWFALINRGITRLTANGEWQSYFTDDPGIRNARRIATDNVGGVWFATDGGGIVRFYDEEWEFFNTTTKDLPSDNIRDVERDELGRIWAATDKGVVYTPDDGETWITHSTMDTLNIAFGCDGCMYEEVHLWLVLKDQGIGNVRIPPLNPTIRIVSAPKTVKLQPGERYVFEVEVQVLDESLRIEDGDSLRSAERFDAPLYGAFYTIPLQRDVEQGQHYTFSNIDSPIIAPDVLGKYQISWRVWQGKRFVTDPIVVEFEVVNE
jgi:Two component regulator propeller